jgi:hypothetical protein
MCLAGFSSYGQIITEVPIIDLQSSYRGCCVPIVQRPVSSCCAAVVMQKEEKCEEVLDITDPETSGLMASPNPTKGRLSVSVPPNLIGYEIHVFDMTGRFVGVPIPIAGTTEEFTIEGKSGVYLIVVRTEKEVIKERILLDTQ